MMADAERSCTAVGTGGVTVPAGTRVQLDDMPGVQVREGLERLGMSPAQYAKFLRLFRDTKRGALDTIAAHIAKQDWAAAQLEVHSLKGTSGTLLATTLYKAAVTLDALLKQCRQGSAPVPGIAESLAELSRAHHELMAGLDRLG
jgi:HPt (histidine-containing phosphotransfer) domain-containing protein